MHFIRSAVCLRRLANLLREYGHDECNDRLVCTSDILRFAGRRDVRLAAGGITTSPTGVNSLSGIAPFCVNVAGPLANRIKLTFLSGHPNPAM
jgi:hypothetical protein